MKRLDLETKAEIKAQKLRLKFSKKLEELQSLFRKNN